MQHAKSGNTVILMFDSMKGVTKCSNDTATASPLRKGKDECDQQHTAEIAKIPEDCLASRSCNCEQTCMSSHPQHTSMLGDLPGHFAIAHCV